MSEENKQQTMDAIIDKHPSICYSCNRSRKPASDDNTKKGYVGCCLRMIDKRNSITTYDWQEITEAKEIGEGWVDLSSEVKLGKGSGLITNFMLLTLEVKSCNQYSPK